MLSRFCQQRASEDVRGRRSCAGFSVRSSTCLRLVASGAHYRSVFRPLRPSAGWRAWSGRRNSRAPAWTAGWDGLRPRGRLPGAALACGADRGGIAGSGRPGTKRRVALASGEDADLWDHVLSTEPVGGRTIEAPACEGPNRRRGRTVKLTLCCTAVDLLPPKDREREPPVRMIAVSAREEDPPRRPARSTPKKRKQHQPLHWMLLTTEGQAGLDTACTVLRWYELRWRIERFFHALKVGTRIEDRRLDEADDLRKCLAFDAITAFRVWDLALLARERPNEPASRNVTEGDIQALCVLASHHGFKVPRGPPEMTIAGFVVLTGGLAGFHPSKRQPQPGMQELWEGVKILSLAVITVQAMHEWNRKNRKDTTRS